MNDVAVKIIKLEHGKDLPLPYYASAEAAGMDLYAAIDAPICLKPMERYLVPAGFKLELPRGFEMQIRPRSGLAYKHGITCLNSPGTIDSDYRGEIFVLLVNLSQEIFTIERAMRIAQAVISPVIQVKLLEEAELSLSERGIAGFGSTGI